MMEVKMGASDCHAYHTAEVPAYYLHSQIRQNETILATLDDIKLHDFGASSGKRCVGRKERIVSKSVTLRLGRPRTVDREDVLHHSLQI